MESTYRLMGVIINSLPWVSAIVLAIATVLLGRKYRQTRFRWLLTITCGLGLQLLAFIIVLVWTNFYWIVTGPTETITEEIVARAAIIDASITLGNQLLTILGTIFIAIGVFRALWHQQDLEAVEEEPEPFEEPYLSEEHLGPSETPPAI